MHAFSKFKIYPRILSIQRWQVTRSQKVFHNYQNVAIKNLKKTFKFSMATILTMFHMGFCLHNGHNYQVVEEG
jgi:hypothetical protein